MTQGKKRMRLWKKLVIILVAIVLVLIIGLQTITFILYNENFHVRFDTSENDNVPTFAEYADLERERVEFQSDKGQNLVGYFYSQKGATKYKAIVVLNHGFGGGGHRSYLPHIEYLAKHDYLVLGFDKTGNDESEGKYVKGMPQGVIDLKYALQYVRAEEKSKDLPVMLYGHSWGGYSVCAVLEDETDITAVVEFSGFNTSMDILLEQGSEMYGDLSIVKPFLWFCDFVNFGFDANYSSLKGLEKTKSNVLLFHSENDKTVHAENSFDRYRTEVGGKENLTFIPVPGRGHNPFSSDDAVKYELERKDALNKLKSDNGGSLTDELYEEFNSDYDKVLGNELDTEIMDTVIAFYDNALANEK